MSQFDPRTLLRPELAHVRLARQAANAQALTARAGFLPQIGLALGAPAPRTSLEDVAMVR